MKQIIKLSAFLLLIGFLFHISCKKEYSCENCLENKPPIANAGADQIIVLPLDSVLLDGSTSNDPDGIIISFKWIKIAGPVSSTIINTDSSKTVVKTLVMGIYKFELTVIDKGGLSAKDTVQVIVNDLAVNQPPVANAGLDPTITLPTDSVLLYGNLSFDPDGTIVSYQWSKISGPASFNIFDPQSVQTKVDRLIAGVYQFELSVTDNGSLSSKDTLQVVVNAVVTNNLPPIAMAGNDTIIQSNQTSCTGVPVTITLNGSNSYDPDGSIVSYFWAGPNVIANSSSAITTVMGLVSGSYTFILQVTDNNNAIDYDTVHVLIVPANRPFVPARLSPIGTLSQLRWGEAMAAVENKIIIAGGSLANTAPTGTVDIYNITTGVWTTAQLSQARLNAGIATLGSKVYFGGGLVPEQNSSGGWGIWNFISNRSAAVDIYDASSNIWSTAQLTRARAPVGAAAANKVFFAGGEATYPVFNNHAFDKYDAGNNIWSNSLLYNTGYLREPVVAGNKIYYAGGLNNVDIGNSSETWGSKRLDIYDALSDSWSIDSLSMERIAMGVILANNKIYWAGGYLFDPVLLDFYPTSSVEIKDLATNATTFDCLSAPRTYITALKQNNNILFFGEQGPENTFDIYDLSSGSWSIGKLPQRVRGPFICYNNIIYCIDDGHVWRLDF
jgi:K319-like protein